MTACSSEGRLTFSDVLFRRPARPRLRGGDLDYLLDRLLVLSGVALSLEDASRESPEERMFRGLLRHWIERYLQSDEPTD